MIKWNSDVMPHRFVQKRPAATFILAILGTLLSLNTTFAQDLGDLLRPETPLVLAEQGSFYVGGRNAQLSGLRGEPGMFDLPYAGQIAVEQMYVQYMIPDGVLKTPIVLMHGGTLSGKSYETTPDGRMGWDEYFVRHNYATYVPDQVGRGRSGFDASIINLVHNGDAPVEDLPNFVRLGLDTAWLSFRFGPAPGIPYDDVQFPVEAADELAKQGVPDLWDYPVEHTVNALAELSAKLGGAVLVGHSQSAYFPLQAALISPEAVKATIALDACPGAGDPEHPLTDAELEKVKTVLMLGVLGGASDGDHNDPAQCEAFIRRFASFGGKAAFINPPALGIEGNTHMLMQDRNNLQIADLILEWLEENGL